jgi:DNA-binding NtrC family response regulator
LLESWHWPGNLGELRNALRRAVVLSTGDTLDPATLRGLELGAAARRLARRSTEPALEGPFASLLELPYGDAKDGAVESFTHAYLQHHLAATRGNITQAAERTGMARPNFSRLMRRYGIEIDRGLPDALAQDSARADGSDGEPLSSR